MEQTYEPTIFEEEINIKYSGFWERFGALVLDGLVLLPLTVVNYYNGTTWKSVVLSSAIGLVAILYKPVLEALYSATLGKMGLSLMVVNRSYQKINAREAVLRNIFQIIIGVASLFVTAYTLQHGGTNQAITPKSLGDFDTKTLLSLFFGLGAFFIYVVDAIFLLASPKKQSLHDLIAGTYVIRKLS